MLKKRYIKPGYISDNLDDYHPIRKHIKTLINRRTTTRRKRYIPVNVDRRKINRRSD
jgi:hypothetical protein